MSSVMPGWGKIAMSGRLLPATRLRISLSKSGVAENLTSMPSWSRKSFMPAWKASDCSWLKPYMISTVLSLALPPPPPPEPPLDRHPASRRADAPAMAACARRRFLMVMRWILPVVFASLHVGVRWATESACGRILPHPALGARAPETSRLCLIRNRGVPNRRGAQVPPVLACRTGLQTFSRVVRTSRCLEITVEEREHASIIDVAEAAGVSPATVSRALRGLPHVSAATRHRVQQAAADLNYVASPAGIGLASGRTRTVGVVVPLATRWFFAQVVAAAEGVLRSWNYDVLLYILGDEAGRSRFFERMPLRRRVDAVLAVALPMSAEETARLKSLRVPVVVVGTHQPEFPTVRIDDEAGARQAVQHLLNLGHEAITMISALEDDDPGFASAPARRAGFRQARAEADRSD